MMELYENEIVISPMEFRFCWEEANKIDIYFLTNVYINSFGSDNYTEVLIPERLLNKVMRKRRKDGGCYISWR